MRLTAEKRAEFDMDVLQAAIEWTGGPTYVLRNRMDWPGRKWHRKGLKTSDVLRACRRLAARGLLEPCPTSYMVMLAWQITPAGRSALEAIGEKE